MIDWATLEPLGFKKSVRLQPVNRWVWADVFSARTIRGTELELWKVLEGDLCERFNCHGFTLGTQDAPKGPYWVQWSEMFKVLVESYARINTGLEVASGDLIVWGTEDRIEHTALIRTPYYYADGITEETRVDGKNGTRPPDVDIPLRQFQGAFRQCRRMFFRRA